MKVLIGGVWEVLGGFGGVLGEMNGEVWQGGLRCIQDEWR